MTCENCGNTASHIISSENGEHCEHCSNLSVAPKAKTDGLLTRNSWRIRRQQSRHEGDMVLPHVYDKASRRQRVNPDFVKLYPNQVKEFFTADELKRDGYRDMPDHISKNNLRREKVKAKEKMDTFFEGDSEKAIEGFLQETGGIS